MATLGVPDNNESVIRRAGTVSMANVTTIGPGDNGMNPVLILYPTNMGALPRKDVPLGDKGIKIGTNAQLTYTHTTHYPDPISGPDEYDIHGNFINGESQTTTTFSNDEAADDNGRSDAGEWYFRRSKTNNAKAYNTKTT